MLTLFALTTLTSVLDTARPIPLDRITLDHARRLDGRRVVVTFIACTPAYTWRGQTIIGTGEQPDGSARVAHLAGKRLDVEMGERIRVAGTLRVIQHPPAFIDGQPWPGWVEIRVTEVGR